MGTSMNSSTSPWLRQAPEDTPAPVAPIAVEGDPVLGESVMARGPVAPLHAAAAVTAAHLEGHSGGALVVHGVHGGAGASTLARLLGEAARTAEQPWRPGDVLEPGSVLLVARLHLHGLTMARECARAWSHGQLGEGVHLLGLVLVDDAPKPVKEQLVPAKLLRGAVPRLWRIPWVEQWRTTRPTDPAPGRLPRRVRATTRSILSAHRSEASQKGTRA